MAETEKHSRPWRLNFHFHHHHDESDQAGHPAVLTHHNRKSSVSQPSQAAKKRLDFTKDIPTEAEIPYPPFINVEGVPNFRDIGGFSCVPSAPAAADPDQLFSVRQGYVYRCSELSQITPKGDSFMTETLNIRILFDLRSEAEAANPLGQPKGVVCISTPVFRRTDITTAMVIQQLRWSTAPDHPDTAGFSQGYVDWYRQIALYGAKSAYRTVFTHIRDKPAEPFVFHCTAGKDRTGVLSALILKLCGVDDATVAWEYSLTVPGMGAWEEAVEQEIVGDSMMPIRSHGGMTRDEARRVCGSRAANMARWLGAVLEAEFGGAANYLKTHCHFSEEDVETMKNNLLVAGEGPVKVVELPSKDHPQT